jgi:ABC-2 type transport system ATP-binding protein
VAGYNDFGNYVEICLAPGADPQHLLACAMKDARVRRFEMVEPSLEEIFLETVESTRAVPSHA